MWLFKKKNEIIEGAKFSIGEEVVLYYQNDRKIGIVYRVNKDKENNIIYDINIMGQCPYVLKNIKENELKKSI